jgi:hypothetical protein
MRLKKNLEVTPGIAIDRPSFIQSKAQCIAMMRFAIFKILMFEQFGPTGYV